MRLVRADYLIRLWRHGERVVPPRQLLPEEAFLDLPPDRARLIALSCPWVGADHPDWSDAPGEQVRHLPISPHIFPYLPISPPSMAVHGLPRPSTTFHDLPRLTHCASAAPGEQRRNGIHLATLAPLLEAYTTSAPAESPRAAAGLPVGVYWDYLSVYHDARNAMLSPAQQRLHERGLAAAAYLFAHAEVSVWLQSRLTPFGDEHLGMAAEQVQTHDANAFRASGQSLLHLHLASLLTPGHMVLDLGRLPRGARLDSVTDFGAQVGATCALGAGALRGASDGGGLGLHLPPPVTAHRFSHLLSSCTRRHEAEHAQYVQLYTSALSDVSACVETIWRPAAGWGDTELAWLAEALPLCRRLRCLHMPANRGITDAGVATLAAAVPPTVTDIDFSMCDRVGDVGLATLAVRAPAQTVRAINLSGTAVTSAVRRAWGARLSPSEMNGTGTLERVIKLREMATIGDPAAGEHVSEYAAGQRAASGATMVMADGGMMITARDQAAFPRDVLEAACEPTALPTPFGAPVALSSSSYDHLFVVAVVGNPGCGKSCLLERFAADGWVDRGPTVGVDVRMRSVRLTHRDVTVRMQIWDAGGADAARPGLNSIYTGVHGVLVCYDSAQRSALDGVGAWLTQVGSYAPVGVSRVLVGTKEDAAPSTHAAYLEHQAYADGRSASPPKATAKRARHADGSRLAERHGLPHVATSALEGGGVDEAFALLAEQMYAAREQQLHAQLLRAEGAERAKHYYEGAPPPTAMSALHTAGSGRRAGGSADERPGGWLARCIRQCLPPCAPCVPSLPSCDGGCVQSCLTLPCAPFRPCCAPKPPPPPPPTVEGQSKSALAACLPCLVPKSSLGESPLPEASAPAGRPATASSSASAADRARARNEERRKEQRSRGKEPTAAPVPPRRPAVSQGRSPGAGRQQTISKDTHML